ncbi:prolyl 3-hydroxylase OGFOD1 [Tiliqua scincoides]|uniref:prolyl 3-hydroxylase OGFOD1 n=1 Tax=Tiliqua scincoides TaxID=71010 RepID=UPI003462D64A
MSGRRRPASALGGGSSPPSPSPSPAAKRRARPPAEFSAAAREPGVRARVAEAWARREALDLGAVLLDPAPFPHCRLPGFVQSEAFLRGLREELLGLDFRRRSNDLYAFKQSSDLRRRTEPHIAALRKLLFEEFRLWLSEVTQVELEPTVDLSCAKYDYTDALLCHDDELEGRRIAFILYLVPSWDKADGGTLDLFSTDDHFQPQLITKSLVPSWNSLTFFEVSPVSFHQVAEVISQGKCRLSVSGWFHGPPIARPPRHVEPLLPRSPHIPRDHEILYDWINPVYLEMDSQAQIQEEFEDRSEILLKDFLKRDKFHLVCEALKKDGLRLSSTGPPNKRFYKRAEEASLPTVLKECMELLGSEAFFLLLSNFTGLKLHFLAPAEEEEEGEEGTAAGGDSFKHMPKVSSQDETSSRGQTDKPKEVSENEDGQRGSNVPLCSGELRHWTNGCYTLVHDAQMTEFALDLLLFCGCEDWDMDYGGFTSYIAKGEDEELLTVSPENNCLALVYRDRETLKFVKYINHRSLERTATHPESTGFWDFCFVYYECSQEEVRRS